MANQIILKYGFRSPDASLERAEPAIDISSGIFYIGYDLNYQAIPFYPSFKSVVQSSLGYGLTYNLGMLEVDVSTVAGGVSKVYVDGSIANKENKGVCIYSASTGLGLYWSEGLINVSTNVGDVTKVYVDGSFAYRDSCINEISNTLGIYFTLNASTGIIIDSSNYNLNIYIDPSYFDVTCGGYY